VGGDGTGQIDAICITKLARRLNSSPRPVVICGTDILASSEIALAGELAQALCRTHKVAGLFYTLTGANAFAAALTHDGPTLNGNDSRSNRRWPRSPAGVG
jgi:thiamine pyrophosphate-dependent acetolactate synthase large subunit-like protein